MHPADFMLPALCWHGAGKVGKNLFACAVEIIFGLGTKGDCTFEGLKQYQDSLVDKMIVMFDEQPMSEEVTEMYKKYVFNPTFNANLKYGGNRTVELTPLFFMTTNRNPKGTVKLEGDGINGVDRRWSIIKVNHSLDHYLKAQVQHLLHEGVFTDEQAAAELLDHTTKDFLNNVIKNEEELAKWLNRCVSKAQALGETRPIGYHGEDYLELVELQADTPINEFLKNLFDNPDFKFEWIEEKTLYEMYKLDLKADSDRAAKFAMQRKNFRHHVLKFFETNGLEIEYKDRAVVQYNTSLKFETKRKPIFISSDFNNDPARPQYKLPVRDNSNFYLSGNWENVKLT